MRLIVAIISVFVISLISVYSIGNTQDKKIVREKEENNKTVEYNDFKNGLLPLPDDKAIVINPIPIPKEPPPSPEPLPHSIDEDDKSNRIVKEK